MSDSEDELTLEEARSILFGIESPYGGNELTDRELSECASALDLDDEGADGFDLSEAHDLATGKADGEEL